MGSYITTAYINPKSVEQFLEVGNYKLAHGSPAIGFVCIFAANYASSTLPYLRANNNNPPTDQPFNPNILAVLQSGAVQTLQAMGIKVLMTVGNGWSTVGWSEFTDQADALAFATYLRDEVVDLYGLDGIDIDDEYSTGTPNDTSLPMVTTMMRQLMPDKLITKALWSDYGPFSGSWNGNTLAQNLNYGWQMSYGAQPQYTLPPYHDQFGMAQLVLAQGFWANQSTPDSSGAVSWIKDNGYGGVMIFGFEDNDNVVYMGELVNDLYGPGNWNYQSNIVGNAVSIGAATYTVRGKVLDQANNQPVVGLIVTIYEKDFLTKDDYLGIGVTDRAGAFQISFDQSAFSFSIFDRKPDIYFIVDDGGTKLLNTRDHPIHVAHEITTDIVLKVDLSGDILRTLINPKPVPGWVGGFAQSNPAFAYPTPDLSSLDMLDNLANIPLLQRQQKVVWPEFSWETEPMATDKRRCFQMFAPDISRLGYTNEGRVYSIICPQQGYASPTLGSFNVEVTVTGNRGWADEKARELAADMTVTGKIWFGPSAHEGLVVKQLAKVMERHNRPFPFTKKDAIQVSTFKPGDPTQPIFPLTRGETQEFVSPEFARHTSLAWTVGHLGVEIGPIAKTNVAVVDDFNELIMTIFNLASGNMLLAGNTLTWNVWFTAPDYVDQQEWAEHAEKWRQSIDADHGSPDGNGTSPRFFDGTPFEPIKSILIEEGVLLTKFFAKHGL